ncbi:MAG: hypothetical protein AB7H71_04840 [Alphaproteobacteria bacterium]
MEEGIEARLYGACLAADMCASSDHVIICEGESDTRTFACTVPKGGDRWEGRRRELRAVNLREIMATVSPN